MERIKKFLESSESAKWIFYGDSITHGAYHTLGFRDYTELFSERVRCELNRTNDFIINTAINGNTTRDLLSGFDWRIRQFAPQVVFIMIGMNDCSEERGITSEEFRSNIQQLCRQLVEINAIPVLQTTCPILPGTTPDREPYFEQYMQVVREVAQQGDWPLIDHLALWNQSGPKHYYWMHDPFHPNAHGHIVFAHTLFKELELYNSDSTVCRLFTP